MRDKTLEIIPTCVPRSAADLAQSAHAISSFSSSIHIDIVDGIFAPSYTWPYTKNGVFEDFDLSSVSGLSAEIHLMVEEPREIGLQFARAGASRILGHVEAFDSENDAHSALYAWRRSDVREVGLGILMGTPLEVLEHHMLIVDVVHVMTIASIGKQGIPYDKNAPARVAEFHRHHPEVMISVDGGVSASNIEELARAGASRFCVGSAIVKAADPAKEYARLKTLAQKAIE
ncbi:hypothetical protein A3A39_02195 [Candidatus Kaiserbacteria bacterium RIFCSPLOWO2_01_FULL_54_13]|uniref:Ribulose-phosphate 3-epimerase n=1 Tax=Candidatus Kaiserbacteria bacterium RIFCSPLOWO2_01_FULL_54_13 TaxID=1798512 RepID=A0A1F6F173_9BACT|nr:MAG: hypothetical protein A3A39_02195 [Candidatus Kaiserbacteria bacterium RIFCSPLOWO2_01_FULL_54_13]